MIELRQGDILTANAEALVNTVNCVGVMGRGIALQFRNAFPENYRLYRQACENGEVQPGRMFVVETGRLTNPRFIVNFPTKRHWRSKSKIQDIETGLEDLINEIEARGIGSVAVPPLGSGLGGLDWSDVRPRIEAAFRRLPHVSIQLFEPAGAPAAERMARPKKIPSMTPGRAALLGLMERYLAGLMDPFVSLREVHKLMYFMQEAGEELKLRYNKAHYGPFAENLAHVLKAIEGYYISGYGDGGDSPSKQLELVPQAAEQARQVLRESPQTVKHFERVAELVAGFETPYGMELLSSLHWVVAQEGVCSAQEALEHLANWNERKRRFTVEQVNLAWAHLRDQGWLPADCA